MDHHSSLDTTTGKSHPILESPTFPVFPPGKIILSKIDENNSTTKVHYLKLYIFLNVYRKSSSMSTVSQSTRAGADSPTGLDDVKEEEPYEEPDEVSKKLLK